ncbi:MAG: hypothetical protein ACT4OQ_10630 [Chloroflexota bacterium]
MLQAGSTTRAAIWTSEDGLSWGEPILIPPEPIETDAIWSRYWISGFGRWGDELLAFGWNGIGAGDGGFPMLWRSADGVTWSVVDTGGTLFGDDYHFPLRSVISPLGQLAVLSVTGLGSGASIYVTDDLANWEEHPITLADQMMSVSGLAASPGLLIAVGTETHPWVDRPETTAHAWISADAETWSPVAPPNPDGTLSSITWDPARERFVAIGSGDDRVPAAWLTTDGSRWSRIPLADDVGQMRDIAVADGLILASGVTGPMLAPETGQTIAWSSHDGVTWRIVPLADAQYGSVVGVTPGSAVTIVNRWSESESDTWIPWAGPVDAE